LIYKNYCYNIQAALELGPKHKEPDMAKATAKQKKLLIPPDVVINGFCYSYCKALLERLKELAKKDKVFWYGEERARTNWAVQIRGKTYNNKELTPVASLILHNLCKQLDCEEPKYPETIRSLIASAGSFLTTFKA